MGQEDLSADEIAEKMHEIDEYLHESGDDVSEQERAEALAAKDDLETLRRKALSRVLSEQEAANCERLHRKIEDTQAGPGAGELTPEGE